MENQELKLKEIQEFWLISAPGDKTCAQTWELMNNVTSKQNGLSYNFKFHIPDLKVIRRVMVNVVACNFTYII